MQLVIFLQTFNVSCMCLKIDVMERVKKLRIWKVSKRGLTLVILVWYPGIGQRSTFRKSVRLTIWSWSHCLASSPRRLIVSAMIITLQYSNRMLQIFACFLLTLLKQHSSYNMPFILDFAATELPPYILDSFFFSFLFKWYILDSAHVMLNTSHIYRR
jgi:hypothetical protein